MIALTR